MVKAYLRYEPLATFGVIASTQSNIVYDHTGKVAITPALEEVILWDLKKGTEVRTKKGSVKQVILMCVRLQGGKNLAINQK